MRAEGSRTLERVGDADIAVVLGGYLAFLTLLGGDEDDAVGGTGAVDGGGGSVLEDVDALDVAGVDAVKTVVGGTALYTVDDEERRGLADGARTTDVDLEALAWLRRRLRDADTRRNGLHGCEGVGGVHLSDVLASDLHRSTGDEFLLLNTVADDNDLIEVGSLLSEGDIDRSTREYDLLVLETEEGVDDGGTVLSLERVLTVEIRNRTVGCAFDHHVDAREGLSVRL